MRRRKTRNISASAVLVTVTGNQSDEEVVRLACGMVDPKKGRLHILYVIEVERGLPVDAEIGPATAKGEEVLKHVEEVAKAYKCPTDAELVQARQAGSAVVQEAVEKSVDTIVLGIPYRKSHGSFSMGDTVPYVLKNAPCRVIVWRDPASGLSANGHRE